MRAQLHRVVSLTLLITLSSSPAIAQVAPPAPTPAPAAKPVDPSASPKDQAREHYARGIAAYDEGDFAHALVELQRAQELAPDYRVLYNIGQVNLQLHRYANGRAALRKYLAEGGTRVPAERKEAVQRDLAATDTKVARVSIQVDAPAAVAEVTVDDVVVGNAPIFEVEVDAGEHRIGARAPKYQAYTEVVTLVGGEIKDLALKLAPLVIEAPPPPPRAPRPWLTAMWIGSGVLASGAVVTGILALGRQRDLENLRKTPDSDPRERADVADSAKTFALTTDIVGASAAVVAGVALYFTLKPSGPNAPVIAVSGRDVSFRGRF